MRSQGMHIAKKAAPKRMQSYYEVLFFKSGTIRLMALSRVFGLRRARLGANAPSLVGIPTVVAHELEAFVGNVLADLTFSGASIEERKHLDPLVTREMLESSVTDYLAGSDPRDPRVLGDLRRHARLSSDAHPGGRERNPLRRCHPHRDAATTAGVDVAFERGGMESTSGRYLSLPGCPNPPSRANAWQPSSKPKRQPEHRNRRSDRLTASASVATRGFLA
jgi:hypothetical protein